MLGLLDSMGYGCISVDEDSCRMGAVQTHEEALTCARLFSRNRELISGIIVVLPNFGEESAVADAIQLSGLEVPVLVQACDDDFDKLDMANRRDAFCGKLSVCNDLYQLGIPFTDTSTHTCRIDSPEFRADIERFAAVCRVTKALRSARIALLGVRPLGLQDGALLRKAAPARGRRRGDRGHVHRHSPRGGHQGRGAHR